MNKKVIIRADGDSRMGLGHIYRCLALSDMLKNEFSCIFFAKNSFEGIGDIIQKNCPVFLLDKDISVQDEISSLKNNSDKNTIIVIDGYHFDSAYQKQIKQWAGTLVAIDDKAEIYFYADMIINHGSGSIKNRYQAEKNPRILTGFSYALLRKEFIGAVKNERIISKAENLFICLGGADPFNITTRVLKIAEGCEFLKKIYVVTGAGYRYYQELEFLTSRSVKMIVNERNIPAFRMVEIIKACQIAISSASSIAMEICAVRTPLIAIKVIDNQTAIFQELNKYNCALGIENIHEAGNDKIKNMIEKISDAAVIRQLISNQQLAIDGQSGQRIIDEIKKLVA